MFDIVFKRRDITVATIKSRTYGQIRGSYAFGGQRGLEDSLGGEWVRGLNDLNRDPQVCTGSMTMDAVGADLFLSVRTVAFDFTVPAVVASPIFLAFLACKIPKSSCISAWKALKRNWGWGNMDRS